MKNNLCQVWLSCPNSTEASKITSALLSSKLVVCVKSIKLKSDYIWKGKIESSNEILLIMNTQANLFEKIEAEIAKLHSYDTYVLEQIPIKKMSSKAKKWLELELDYGNN